MTFIFNSINQPFVKKGQLPFLELKWNLGHRLKFRIKATENSGSLDEKNFSAEDTRISDTENFGGIPENRGIDNMGERDMERDVKGKTDGTGNTEKKKEMKDFKHLWLLCENCYTMHWKKEFNLARICSECGVHMRMSSEDRLALLIDKGTWIPMDEDMVSADPIKFDNKLVCEEYQLLFSFKNYSLTKKYNTAKKERIYDKYTYLCPIDRPDFFEDFYQNGINLSQIFLGCARYDKRDYDFFEKCSKKGGLSRPQILWTLSQYYKSDEDDFQKFFSNNYKECSKYHDEYYSNLENKFYENNNPLDTDAKYLSNLENKITAYLDPLDTDPEFCSKAFEEEFYERVLDNHPLAIKLFKSDKYRIWREPDFDPLAPEQQIPETGDPLETNGESVSNLEDLEDEIYEERFTDETDNFQQYCNDFRSIIPLFYKSFFENRVDLPRLEQFFSKFGIDLSKFFESFPKHEIDLRKFFQECSSLGIDFAYFIEAYEEETGYDFFDLVFRNPKPRTLYGIYKFMEDSYKNELNLVVTEIDERERFRILSKLSETFCQYNFDRRKLFESITENIRKNMDKYGKKNFSKNRIVFAGMDSKDHIDFANDSRENIEPDQDFPNPTDLGQGKGQDFLNPTDPARRGRGRADALGNSSNDPIDLAIYSNAPNDFAMDSRHHSDPDEAFKNRTGHDIERDSYTDASERRRDAQSPTRPILFSNDSRHRITHIDFPTDSNVHMALSGDGDCPTRPVLDPNKNSDSSGQGDSNKYEEEAGDCQTRPVLDPNKNSDSSGQGDSNKYEEEAGDCQKTTDLDPEKDSSRDSACPTDDINVHKEEDSTLASIFTDSEDVTNINEEDSSERGSSERGSSERGSSERGSSERGSSERGSSEREREEEDEAVADGGSSVYSGFAGTSSRCQSGSYAPRRRRRRRRRRELGFGLEEISKKDKEGSKKEEESAESSDFESKFEFDWDGLRKALTLKKKDSDFGSKSEFEWGDGWKEEEESAESNDFRFEPPPFHNYSFEDEYVEYVELYDYHQKESGLPEAIQTGIGELNGIPVAMGVMDFEFHAGTMGAVVGEKITRLIEYATKNSLPLIIVCASGGARMQEGILGLMQMAKISKALYDYYHKPVGRNLFYIPILATPTTGGVLASFGMLGDIVITEPDTVIAFAGKRVIEEILKEEVPEGAQTSDNLFEKGLFDLMVPRNILKSVLSELLMMHGFFPLNKNQAKH
jgi:acetyl-CoA carboxylase carboxyl transferase beta subunit